MVSVRSYEPRDLAAVREICVLTGYRGTDARGVMADTALLPDAYAEPYVVHDPGLAFVADDAGTAVGYILGTTDTVEFARWFGEAWLPVVAPRHAAPPEHPGNFEESILRDLHNPSRMVLPELAGHPAHLHIDLLPGYQGRGLGRLLMEAFLAELRARGVQTVHLGMDPANTRARAFYEKLGFERIPVPSVPDAVYMGRTSSPREL
jgi:ribosomal protein S18 acetylase RimI-like enzyme